MYIYIYKMKYIDFSFHEHTSSAKSTLTHTPSINIR